MASLPAAIAVTTPIVLTEATDPADEVLHTPPLTVLLNVVALPTQRAPAPDMVPASGTGVMERVTVAVAVPQAFVTV